MAHVSDPAFAVLHGLRLKGLADTDVLAAPVGLEPESVRSHLEALAVDGLVVRRDGRVKGWSLTPAGRHRHAELVAVDVTASGDEDGLRAAYERFLELNPELLAVCTAWQIRDDGAVRRINDHTDPGYDAEVVDRLVAVDERAQPVCAELADRFERFGHYGPALARAVERVRAGDHDWFTKPTIASYHTVWFELHEDLLVSLGIERSAETRAPA